jgi:hypothetical protein
MRLWGLTLFLLAGCAAQSVQTFTPFVPKAEMKSQATFDVDLAACRAYALEYLSGKSDLDPVSVASATAQGALSNLAEIAVSPVATGLSGVGSGSSEITSELGLNSNEGKKVVAVCLHDRGERSGAYHVMAPEL